MVSGRRKFGTAFDRAAARVMIEHMGTNANDLSSPEVWNFVTLVVLLMRNLALGIADGSPSDERMLEGMYFVMLSVGYASTSLVPS